MWGDFGGTSWGITGLQKVIHRPRLRSFEELSMFKVDGEGRVVRGG